MMRRTNDALTISPSIRPAIGTSTMLAATTALMLLAGHAAAMQEAAPVQPEIQPDVQPNIQPLSETMSGRRAPQDVPATTTLAFRDVSVRDMLPFIVQMTGKVVMPQQDVLSRKVTVFNDRPIPSEQALDLVFIALQQAGVAVVETDATITLRDFAEIVRQDVPVLGPDQSALSRRDLGSIVQKVFALRHSTAKSLGDLLKNSVPDYAKLTVDEESNQVAVTGSISFLQRIERLIESLDRPSAGAVQTETFRLRYADAAQIKDNIEELFTAGGATSATRRTGGNRQQNQQQGGFRFPGQQAQPDAAAASGSGELRVSANTQQNSVTVVADPAVLAQIRSQIEGQWDLPLPDEAVIPKIYDLKNSDPVKVANLLEGLFGRGTASRTTTQGGGGGGGGGQNQAGTPTSTQGVGRLAGQFSFQAIPEASRLVVVAKSPDNIAIIDKIIEGIDQPQTVGLPGIIQLKHASAEDLAEQLNALLSLDGTLAQIRRAESGLSEGNSGQSPFSQETVQNADGSTTSSATTAQQITFWWQRSRTPTDRRSASNLIGQLRIVPVWRQNALMVIAPPEYKESILKLIEDLDKPGRQVLISAIVAEVSRDDALNFGLRWSSQAITPTNADNSLGISSDASGTSNNFAKSLFDTSVLNVNADLNVVLQALAQKTDVSILSEPKIFTSDNQEAEFFDGQDIPFVTDSQTNDQGNLIQSFDYRAVGIQLRVRPRITVRGDVDLRVNLELSSIVPGQTLFGGFVVDRRETTTQLIVNNSQTIVISGIIRQELSDVVRKVPLLGDIPLLGWLFRSKEKTTSATELLVFITPVVVNNTDSLVEVNQPYRDQLRRIQTDLGKSLDEKGIESSPLITPPTTPAPQ